MTLREFRLPDIGEGVSEGEIVEWFVHQGDSVSEDAPIVEVMTDKATVTIGAPCDGRVVELRFEVGAIAEVGQVLFVLEPANEPRLRQAPQSSRPPASAVGEISEALPGAALFERRETPTRPLATPATRRLAKEMGVDLHVVRPSGAGGRVTSDDVRRAAGGGASKLGPRSQLEEREPILGIRRKIAERMHQAKTTAAHFTFVEECDVSALIDARERLAPEAARQGVTLTFMPFIIRAVTAALRRHPRLNSAVDERTNELVYKKYYDIGFATATDAGLVVPVVRQADRLSLFDLGRRVEQLALAAREGQVRPEELRGSTFTITSLGKRGGLLATPILNYPEVGILGVHRMRETPVVRDGEIVIGRVMLLSLSFDHRVIDGHMGAEFAYDVIEMLKNPERLLYE